MKTLILALLLSFSASAEVAIFTQTLTDTATGGGKVKIKSYTGYLVFDTETYEVRDILVHATTKTFTEIGSDATLRFVGAGVNKYTLWAVMPVFDIGGATFKGAASVTTLGTTNRFWVPKTLTVKGAAVEDAVETLHEFGGAITYHKTKTTTANKAGLDFATVVENLEDSLFLKGYTLQ